MPKRSTFLFSLVSLIAIPCTVVTAETPDVLNINPYSPWYLADAEKGWYFDAFIGLVSEPTYAGSDNYEQELGANARAIYRTGSGQRYFISPGEIGGLIPLGENSQFFFFLEYEEGRSADDDPLLQGFEDVDNTVEGQFSYTRKWGTTHASVVLQPDLLSRGKGFVWFTALGKDWLINDQFRLSASVDLSGADSEYMQTEFGVSPEAAIASGLDEFEISSGIKSVSTSFGAEYFFSKNLSLIADVEFEQYIGNSIDSPLIKDEGSERTYEASVGLRYRF